MKKIYIYVGIGLFAGALIYVYRSQVKKGIKMTISKISDFANKLKNKAEEEYNFWKNGTIKEGNPLTMERLREYWREGAGVKNWSDYQMINEAWSAAFISYIVKKSGAGDQWKYAPSHSVYITDSIKNRKLNLNKAFKGYKPEEVKLQIGDIIGKPRQAGVNYDTTGSYKSHTDVVVNITKDYADTIGGNVSNSVSITRVPLKNGKIDKTKAPQYFVVIKNTLK